MNEKIPVVVCPRCERDINETFSCTPDPDTIPFGGEPGYEVEPRSDVQCRDCAVTHGATHHVGCCVARCRLCDGGQYFGCPHWADELTRLEITP